MPSHSEPHARSTTPPQLRAIVADDDAEMRRLLSNALMRAGYTVTEADSGLQLIQALQRSIHEAGVMPDLVVSDVRMPRGSGLQVLEAIRLAGWAVPVILVTGFGDDDVFRQGSRLGAARVLSKPFKMEELREAVFALLPSSVA